MSAVNCTACDKTLNEGDTAWADEWKVLDVTGEVATWRIETRYTCDDCAAVSA